MYEDLERFLSEERLKPYLEKTNNDKNGTVNLYEANLFFSQYMYISINFSEIILRNVCNNKLKKEIGDKWYLDNKLLKGVNALKGQWAINKIQETIVKIKKRKFEKGIKNYNISNGDIVSNLDFGFWSNLFCGNYNNTIWLPYLKFVFQNKDRKKLHNELDILREFRNRIFHYEPIIFDNDVFNRVNMLLKNLISYTTNNKFCDYIFKLSDIDYFTKKINLGAPLNQ